MAGDETIALQITDHSNDATSHPLNAADLLFGRTALLQSIFNSIDLNGDGVVDPKELVKAIKGSHRNSEIPTHVIQSLFEKGDQNEDGLINFEEFCVLVERPEMGNFFKKFFHIPTMSNITTRAKKYKDSWKWCPPPIINLTIILVQIGICIYDNNLDKPTLTQTLAFEPSKKNEIWRYYTYSLIHNNWAHLIGNSIFQLIFGTALEPVHGYRVALIFLVGVLAGSLASAVFDSSSILVGASGGVYALILSWISDIFLNWSQQHCPMVSLMPVILFIVWDWILASARSGQTSLVAHVAGGLTGLSFGIIILKNIEELKFEKYVRIFSIIFLALYFCLFIAMNYFDIHT